VTRIGFDGRALASPAAGMRRYARELFAALALVDPALTVVAVGAPAGADVPPGIEVVPAPASLPTNLGWMLTGLPRAARRARLDVFHAPSYTAPFLGPRPLVLTIHDVSYERHPEWYPYKRDPLRRLFYRRSARAADRIITDSAFSKSEIVAAYGVPGSSIDVVPLAAAAAFTAGPRLPLPAGCPQTYVLHVGDLHARRNLPMVARAVAAVRARRGPRDLALVLAGVDRGSAADLRATSDAAGGPPLVVFAGVPSEAVLVALYRAAAALVYPSRYEGFGLPLLEAMRCGTPVIAARTSSIPEVVGDGGLLLDPDDEAAWIDAIGRVLDDEAQARALRSRGLERAKGFSWERTAAETARVYRLALSGRRA
jgi:glycosyltransferase involved in cell wall biosynthesis